MISLSLCSRVVKKDEGSCETVIVHVEGIDHELCMKECFLRRTSSSDLLDVICRHEPLLLEQLLSLSNQNSTVDSSAATMKFYLQSRHCDSIVDYQLILSLISYNYQTRSGILVDHSRHLNSHRCRLDHILVFLPGPDDISILNELVLELKHAHQ